MVVAGGSQFLDNVFMTSANIALPSIQKEFGVTNGDLQWMISAYTLTFGGFLLLAGVLSDRYVYMCGVGGMCSNVLDIKLTDRIDMVASIFSVLD